MSKQRLFYASERVAFPEHLLREWLPDIESALFFAKLYKLDTRRLGELVSLLFNTTAIAQLLHGATLHSSTLQEYVVETIPELEHMIEFTDEVAPPKGELLPELWRQHEVVVADSIREVALKLQDSLSQIDAKGGRMVLQSMMQFNRTRPTFGVSKIGIERNRVAPTLVILDDSGSVTHSTVQAIIEEVLALAYQADAHFALVSSTTRYWRPGTYTVSSVMGEVQSMGTHYETLVPLFQDTDWGTVITIADYDSSRDARRVFKEMTNATVDQVLDISLVSRQTFLSEVIAQRADQPVKQLLVARGYSQIL